MKKLLSILLAFILIFSVCGFSAFAAGNSYSTAEKVTLGRTYNDMLSTGWENDFFKFTVSSSSNVKLEFTSEISVRLYVYNSSNERIWSSSYLIPNSISGLLTYSKDFNFSSGTYYLVVGDTYETGNYSFKLSTSSSSSVSMSASQNTVNLNTDDSSKVTFSYTGTNPNKVTISYSISDKSIVSASWGSWKNKSVPLTLTGLKEGTTTVKVSLKDSVTNTVLDSETITVNVSDSGSGDGGDTSGSTGFFLFDIFYFIIGFIAVLLGF